MDPDDLRNYLFAKLAEAPKLVEDNIKVDSIPFKERDPYFKIKKHLDYFLNGNVENRFVVMPGLRGTGKTTILYQIYHYLMEDRNINQNNILFISVDELRSYLGAKLHEAVDIYLKEVHETSPVFLEEELFILIDEAHFDPDWSLTGKIIFDQTKKIFMLFTGSSALDIELNVDAARRVKKEPIFPLNFSQYNYLKHGIQTPKNLSGSVHDSIFRDDEKSIESARKYELELKKSLIKITKPMEKEFEDYLYFREFPFGLNMGREEVNERMISMIDRVVEKDVLTLKSFNTGTRDTIYRVISFLALQKPGGTSDVKLADKLGKSPRIIREILNILEKTHLIFSVKPYGGAGRMVRKPWKYYFLSPNINAALRAKLGKGTFKSRETLGVLAENMVGAYFFRQKENRNMPYGIFYDPEKRGVDFLLVDPLENVIPVEVGVGRKNKSQINRAVRKYSSEHGILISKSTNRITKEDQVVSIPLITLSFL